MSYDAIIIIIIIIDLKTYFCFLSLFFFFFSLDVDETCVFVSCCGERWSLVSYKNVDVAQIITSLINDQTVR